MPHMLSKRTLRAGAPLILLVILAARSLASAPTLDDLPMNRVRVIGSHNSYKLPIDPPLLKLLTTFSDQAKAFDYSHATLTEQLDLGLRGLELDVYHDPEGGRFATPLGLEMVRRLDATPAAFDAEAMREPGFKVLHVADIDFRSTQPTLRAALAELKQWSDANPGHLPVVITMNVKDEKAPVPGAAEPPPIDAAALAALDAELLSGLGKAKLLTPDVVRGDADTLEEAVLSAGWPPLRAVRGRFAFVIDEGGEKRRAYSKGHPSLRGRVMFTTAPPGSPHSAILVMNDPVRDEEKIRRRVELGYLVRTRADAYTREARSGDTTRFEAAKRSGAQIISTDYYRPDPRFDTGYQVRFSGGAFVQFPGQAASAPEGDSER